MPKLTTERLELRPWQEVEAAAFFDLTQDQGFNRFSITDYTQNDLESARAWVKSNLELHRQKSLGKFGVWTKSDQILVGMGGLTPYTIENESVVDLTYRLRTSAWGKGFGSEMAQALVRHGFEILGLKEITATIMPDNLPSKKIAENLGFEFDRRIVLLGVDTDLYRLPRKQWRNLGL